MKGISPLIAAVLLIAVTVTIGILVSAWAAGFTSSSSTSVTNKSNELSGCSGAAIEVETVYIRGTTGATAVLKNSGLINDLQIISAQLYLINGTNFSAAGLPITNFDRGGVTSLNFNNINVSTSCPGNFSMIVVQSSCPSAAYTFDGQQQSPICG